MIWALHGAFGDAEDWAALALVLGTDQFSAIDLWADEHSLPLGDWAQAFNQRVSEVDPSPVLLAYSMGARLGLHALIADSHMWRGAILVSPHPGLSEEKDRLTRREIDGRWTEKFDDLSWREFWRDWTGQPVLAEQGERLLPLDRKARRRGIDLWSLSRQADLRPEFGRIECPVVWVTGERDSKFTAIAAAAVPLISRARHVIVPDVGHRVPWDAPGVFAGLVGQFWDGVRTGQGR